MHDDNRCCCLILNYNDADNVVDLLNCIKDFKVFDEVLVVDNCSTDNSLEKLGEIKGISLVKTHRNGGYGAGNNYGIIYARNKMNCRYVLLCNPDIRFSEQTVHALLDRIKNDPMCAIISAKQKNIDGNVIYDKAWKIPGPFKYALTFSDFGNRLANTHYSEEYFKSACVEVDCVPGAMFMLNADIFIKIGGYDESVFLFAEEDIIGWKIRENGYKTLLLTDADYIHEHGTSVNKSITDEVNRRKLIYNSKLIFMEKYMKYSFIDLFIAKTIRRYMLAKCYHASKKNKAKNNYKYILLSKYIPSDNNASQKAPLDIESIFNQSHGKTYRLFGTNIRFLRNISIILHYLDIKCRYAFRKNSTILFVQWPIYSKKPFVEDDFVSKLGFKKKVALIHDLDGIRFFPNDECKRQNDVRLLNEYDCVICHNDKMKEWLKNNGLKSEIVPIELFDYLLHDQVNITKYEGKYRIVIAGNLDKSTFMENIDKYTKCKMIAYGTLTKYKMPSGVLYKGSLSADKLMKEIEGEFGLIWDGETGYTCSGLNGNYMKYNNPHKLSFYISCGIPVIVWKDAAIAKFVMDNRIGLTISSLTEIDKKLADLSKEEYSELLKNVSIVQNKVINGYYTKRAINTVKSLIKD